MIHFHHQSYIFNKKGQSHLLVRKVICSFIMNHKPGIQ